MVLIHVYAFSACGASTGIAMVSKYSTAPDFGNRIWMFCPFRASLARAAAIAMSPFQPIAAHTEPEASSLM